MPLRFVIRNKINTLKIVTVHLLCRFAKVPDDPPAAQQPAPTTTPGIGMEKSSSSTSGSSSGSSSESEDSEDERARKLLLLQEQVFLHLICIHSFI